MGLLDGLADTMSNVGDAVTGAVDDMGQVSKIPFRGVLWEIDLSDPQKFTLTPLGRGILAAAALYGAMKMIGGK